MDNKEVEEILKEYKLSEEEHDELYDMIKRLKLLQYQLY